ncbi:sulfotransferase [Yinghuangia sp. ASG 101]|uniref:sulfotransferase family protein n=1 Tax=Yinghuangia sp. ASG 101 TaxID=2896848 RepID=UPI001E5D0E96|nr:sulfotransferase [Yinghuangia sp. ASG 101]UGQ11953.1 sulfotransferase [Yinghuangia sp. ASG 101]
MPTSPDVLVDRARTETGWSDFGPDGWQEGLDRFLEAAAVDLGADRDAVAAVEAVAARRLTNRLRIERWYARNPAPTPEVEGPVVILGLPRTATTALLHVLALDPRFRCPRWSEVHDPVPDDTSATARDDRLMRAQGRSDERHIRSVDGPMEDVHIPALHFHNQELGLPLPTFTSWWRDADFAGTVAYHERVLRLLHARRPPYRWLLKAPQYIFQAASLARHYPGARFVMTHRDPAEAFPSTCSTVAKAQRDSVPTRTPDPHVLGRDLLDHFVAGTRRVIADREHIGEHRFHDVGQREFETDPIATVERVYDFLGLRLTDDVRASMTRWAAENRRGARGQHRYTPEEYGHTTAEIRHAFAEYVDRFGALATTG